MKSIIKWKNYLSLYIIFIALINIAFLYLPLVNVFGYEFSVLNSMLLVILTSIYTIKFYEAFFTKNNHLFTSELFESVLLLLLIPFAVSIINSIINGFCSFIDGILFYLVITFPSVIIGVSLGLLSVFITNRFRVFLLFVIYLAILSIIFWEIYFYPQVYVYNPIIGFFPGTIYDEGISVSWTLVLYRLLNIIFFGYIINSIIKIKKGKRGKLIPSLVLIILLIAFYWYTPQLGFSTTKSYLEEKLDKQLTSDHFVVHFDNRIDEKKIKILALYQEYYFQQLTDFFKVEIKERVTTYIFYNSDQKKELFGSRNADVAKPWLNQVYISFNNWEHTLKHELAHCFSGTFGSGIFDLASGMNPLLTEGVAEAADGIYDENSIHYMAALAYNNGYKEDIGNLLTKEGFFSRTSTLAYIYGGSFIKYLIDNRGIENFRKYYASGEFRGTYEVDLNEFLNNYYSFLTKYGKTSVNQESANYYFGHKSLFHKLCPRAISVKLNNGWEQYNNENYNGARRIFTNILETSNNYSALIGLVKSFVEDDSLIRSIDLIQNRLSEFEGTSYYYNLGFTLADIYSKTGDFQMADSIYKSITEQIPSRRLQNLAILRIDLIRNNKIINYLNGSDYDKYHILKSLNKKKNNYATFPVLITLSNRLNEDYEFFMENLNMDFRVNNYESSYAMLKLSEHMNLNYDFSNSRKLAGLALRYDDDKNFNYILNMQYNKANWFYQNHQLVFDTFKIMKTN